MMIDANRLWQRERKRRYALWDLERLHPGSDRAIEYLAILDEIERQDHDDPIGDAVTMSVDELRECVPETEIEGVSGSHCVVVLDEHIPEPWKTRFEEASTGSTRLRQGSYAGDWRRFLRLWEREMQHLAAHREMR
ncbi:hypothetical protein BK664_01465 [Pseudomonas brassicacearum]|uniref:Uncharacterized protein n=2 Tax=Pseudomonas brassicacearum TaxID=930166 RepID=A0A423JX75_9PSED|nr:hypothetical protein BK664_01465 [Pseudomonas brassicacearum]